MRSTSKFAALLSGAEQNGVVWGLSWCLLYAHPFSWLAGMLAAGSACMGWVPGALLFAGGKAEMWAFRQQKKQ